MRTSSKSAYLASVIVYLAVAICPGIFYSTYILGMLSKRRDYSQLNLTVFMIFLPYLFISLVFLGLIWLVRTRLSSTPGNKTKRFAAILAVVSVIIAFISVSVLVYYTQKDWTGESIVINSASGFPQFLGSWFGGIFAGLATLSFGYLFLTNRSEYKL